MLIPRAASTPLVSLAKENSCPDAAVIVSRLSLFTAAVIPLTWFSDAARLFNVVSAPTPLTLTGMAVVCVKPVVWFCTAIWKDPSTGGKARPVLPSDWFGSLTADSLVAVV